MFLRAHTQNESLVAHSPHHSLNRQIFFASHTAYHRFVSNGPQRRAVRRALREVRGELLGHVAHNLHGDTQFVNGRALPTRKRADPGAALADSRGRCHCAAKNPPRRSFIHPRTFGLPVTRRRRKQRHADQERSNGSHSCARSSKKAALRRSFKSRAPHVFAAAFNASFLRILPPS
jgi:hypothetical protein